MKTMSFFPGNDVIINYFNYLWTMLVKCILLILFFAVMIGVGIYCRRTASNVQGFVLGGRNVGSWLTAFAFGTSYFSAVIFVGYAGQFGWKYGLALIGSLLAWRILGRRTRLMTQHLQSATMPDFFGKRFFSTPLKVAASVIVFIFLIPYTASLYNGLSRLFSMAFHVDYVWCVLGMAVLTGIYVVVGGYMATAVNDFIQGLIMLVGICAVIASVLNGNGGFTAAVESLSQIPSESAPNLNGAFVSFLGPQPIYLLGVVMLTSLGTWGLPQMVGKFYAIRNEAAIRKGTFISTFFAIIVAGGCYFLGGFGRLYGQSIEYTAAGTPVYDSIVPSMLATLPDLMIGVVIILVLSASMSTLSSLVLTSGSTLTLDIIDPAMAKARQGKHMTDRTQLLSIRLLVLFFIIVSSVIAIVQAKSSVTFIAQARAVLHRRIFRDRHRPGQELRDLHRAAHGHFLGCAGRRFPGPVPVRPLLEAHDFRFGLGLLHRGRGRDVRLHVLHLHGQDFHQPVLHLADQRRHAGDAAGPGGRARSQLLHQAKPEGGGRRDVQLLQQHGEGSRHGRPVRGTAGLEDEIVTETQYVTGGRQAAFVVQMVHVEEIQRMAFSKADFRAGIMQRTDPFSGVDAAEELVHQIGRESAVCGLVLPAEPGPEGVAE